MTSVLFFTSACLFGIFLLRAFFTLPRGYLFVLGSAMGVFVTSWFLFLISMGVYLLHIHSPLSYGVQITFSAIATCSAMMLYYSRNQLRWNGIALTFENGVVFVSLLLSAALMFVTFQYGKDEFAIKTLVLSDFSHHIPLIRSFSLGENIPPHAPLFGGELIRYHFLFYLFVGTLERLGMRIDWAINLTSSLGFSAFLISLAFFVQVIFQKLADRSLILLTLFFTITSSTFAFLQNSPTGKGFLSSGPYYHWNNVITGLFWTLTIFTNQRHFAFGIALGLFLFSLLLHEEQKEIRAIKPWIVLGIGMGLLPFFHGIVFTSFMMISAVFFLISSKKKEWLLFGLVATLVAIPQIQFLAAPSPEAAPHWAPGYGLEMAKTIPHFFNFWFQNLGFKFLLLPVFIWFLPKFPKKIVLASLVLFVVPNLIQFGPEVWTNHKFFNIWLIFVNLSAANFILLLWDKNRISRFAASLLIGFMTMSGIIDLAPIFRDDLIPIPDWKKDPTALYLLAHTEPNEIIATSYNTFHPASLVGRPVFLGWPYFSWSAGFNTVQRMDEGKKIFETTNLKERCVLLQKYKIRYIVAGRFPPESNPYIPNLQLLTKELTLAFSNMKYLVFDSTSACNSNRN